MSYTSLAACSTSHYFQGSKLRGCGSPHTPANYVWSLAHCVQGLTSPDPAERADMFRYGWGCGQGSQRASVG
jgi:meiotically up-regulated gene 157 (Mug157) protein